MNELNRVSLGGLRAIEAVGRLGGLRAAAEEIGVTPGAISQQVQKAEEQLGCTLFERLPRGLRPTARGEAVMVHLGRGMAELAEAVALATRRQENTLTVSAAPVFAATWLVWRLARFQDAHPEVHIRIDATTDFVDPNASDVDVCIRVGRGDWPEVRAEKLADQYVFPVCSPALASKLASPRDLAKVPIIRDEHAMFGWEVWLKPNGLDETMLADGPVFSNGSLCLDAAIAGQGVFLAWETLAADAIAGGRLTAPFSDRYATGFSHWFVTSRYGRNSPNVRAFQRWLEAELATSLSNEAMRSVSSRRR